MVLKVNGLCTQELRNKNWKVVEALTKAEQSLQNKIMNEKNSDVRIIISTASCRLLMDMFFV